MDYIKQYYPEYLENSDDLCFKICRNENVDYIVVMCKLPNTITNETRRNIANQLYAKLRGNKFMVLKIFCKLDPLKTLSEIQNSVFKEKKITYKTNEEVSVDDFDDNLEKVHSTGIHYFKSIEAAFYYGEIPINYSGKWFEYYDNGNKKYEGNILNGEQNGKWIYYYDDGIIKEERDYFNDKQTGKWTSYYNYAINFMFYHFVYSRW